MRAIATLTRFAVTTGLGAGGILLSGDVAFAQITPDGTLPTAVTQSGNVLTIDGGARSGNNLFHSFGQFSVPTGGTAFFNNALDVQNIFSRVTGGAISNIDGLIQANGSANLFLLNPSGILFGPNASLNIGGSFIGTTANSIKFADGVEFSATNSNGSPLLTISVPLGLQFGSQANPITSLSSPGLQVQAGQTLGLLGGNLTLAATQLMAPSGRIELGSVGSNSLVALNISQPQMMFGYTGVSTFQDIHMTQGAIADVSGTGGTIQVQGRDILLSNSAQISNHSSSQASAGNILIRGSEAIKLLGTGELPNTGISTELLSGTANAQGADITMEAPSIQLTQGAMVRSGMDQASGTAGNIALKANMVLVDGGATLNVPSKISTMLQNNSAGVSGNISIDTQILQVLNGGLVVTGALKNSQLTGGNITINATDIAIDGFGQGPTAYSKSAIVTQIKTNSSGVGGDIQVTSPRIRFTQGGRIISIVDKHSNGKAGNIWVKAQDIQAIGGYADDFTPSGIASIVLNSPQASTGIENQSGNILIETDRIQLKDGATIDAGVFSSDAKPGTLTIHAQTVEASGVSDFVQESGFFANSYGNGFVGKSGKVTIEADTVRLSDGAKIVVGSVADFYGAESKADAGDISIKAHDIQIVGAKATEYPGDGIYFNRSGIIASSGKGASGAGGTIQVETDRLSILDGAEIIANTFTQGNAGSIHINAVESITIAGNVAVDTSQAASNYANPRVDDRFRSRISTSVEENATGSSGLLRLDTANLLVSNGGEITSSNLGTGNAGGIEIHAVDRLTVNASNIAVNGSRLGNAGNLLIEAKEIYLANGATLQAEVMKGDQGNISLNANVILMRYGSQISTNATEEASGGSIQINAPLLIGLENSDIVANAVQGRGGNIEITTQGLFGLKYRAQLTPENDITASSEFGINGTVDIITPGLDPNAGLITLPGELVDPTQQVAQGCAANQGSSFVITGRGGMPTPPIAQFSIQRPWADLRRLTPAHHTVTQLQSRPITSSPLVEATGWRRNADGKLELFAESQPAPVPTTLPATCAGGR